MMVLVNMEIILEEEPTQMLQPEAESPVDEEAKDDHVPISQLFQLRKKQQLQLQSLHSSSMTLLEIDDCSHKAARKRPRDEHSDYRVVSALSAAKGKDEVEEAWPNSSVMKRAKEIQASLPSGFPSFFKSMTPSAVCRGFSMPLPTEFCQMHLPSHDTTVILVGESGKQYEVNFLTRRTSLSGGWKKFSIEHGVLVGDALVFHLIGPSKFKVYVVRVDSLGEVDAALGLLGLETSAKQTCNTPSSTICQLEKDHVGKNDSEPFPQDISQYEVHTNNLSYPRAEENQSRNGCLDIGSSEVEGIIRSSEEVNAECIQSRGTDELTVLVNGSVLDFKLSKRVRKKYNELCCSQKSYLHDNLHRNINSTMAAEIITETVNISDAIKASTISAPQADFVNWENTLSGFELLGMDVGFLRDRIRRLLGLAFESKAEVKSRRYKEAKLERACTEQEAKHLELKLLKKKEELARLDAEIEAFQVNARRHKLMFKEVVNAPW